MSKRKRANGQGDNDRKFHPAAELFPLLEGDEFQELVADIKAHGLLHPIVRYEKLTLDGRNRERACELAGVEPNYFDRDDIADPIAYVISANIKRRHLTSAQKRDLIAKLLEADPTKSNRRIAKQIGADHTTVADVRTDLEPTGGFLQLKKR